MILNLYQKGKNTNYAKERIRYKIRNYRDRAIILNKIKENIKIIRLGKFSKIFFLK